MNSKNRSLKKFQENVRKHLKRVIYFENKINLKKNSLERKKKYEMEKKKSNHRQWEAEVELVCECKFTTKDWKLYYKTSTCPQRLKKKQISKSKRKKSKRRKSKRKKSKYKSKRSRSKRKKSKKFNMSRQNICFTTYKGCRIGKSGKKRVKK